MTKHVQVSPEMQKLGTSACLIYGGAGALAYCVVHYLYVNGIWASPELSAWIYKKFIFRKFSGPYRDSLMLALLISWCLSIFCMVYANAYTTALARGMTRISIWRRVSVAIIIFVTIPCLIIFSIPVGVRSIVNSFSLGVVWFFMVTPGRALLLSLCFKRYILMMR